jgi:tellurite resistance protein/rubredoxin
MLIWGTKTVKRRLDGGAFECPQCGGRRDYELVRAQRHGHVYWIPLFSTGEPVTYVECRSCGSTYDPAILDRAPTDAGAFRDHLGAAVLAATLAVASADGNVDANEIELIQDVVSRITGKQLDATMLERMATQPGVGDPTAATRMLASLAMGLTAQGKEMVVKAALFTAMADGSLDPRESDLVVQFAAALDVSQAHLRGILADVGVEPLRA